MPYFAHVGSTPRSMPRITIEYGGCSHTKRSRLRRSLVHCASTMYSAGNVECPRYRIFPWWTRSRQRAERLVDVGVVVGAVDLVQVDVVGAEATQAVLDLGHDPAARAAVRVRVLAHRGEELRREDDVVAAAVERLADDLLRLARRVHVGGVDEVDPGVEAAVDDPRALVVVGLAPRAEHHGAEAVLADLDPGASERSHAHDPYPISP